VQDSYDSIAIFLCIHLVQRYQLLCHKRCVPGKRILVGTVVEYRTGPVLVKTKLW
jgi:hypothetical protein